MSDDISRLKNKLKCLDEREKTRQDLIDTKKNLPGVTLPTLDIVKNYNPSIVGNRIIDTTEFVNGIGYFNTNFHHNEKIKIQEFENFIFDKISEVKFKRLVAKKRKNVSLFRQVANEILRMENIKESVIDLFVKYNIVNSFYSLFIDFLMRDDVVDNKKLRFSIINLISKSLEINELKGVEVNFSIDEISNSIILNLIKKPISREYMVNLNLKFKPNGSVSFMCYDSDDCDKSYITGSVSRYDTYMSSIKFKTIIDMLNSGA